MKYIRNLKLEDIPQVYMLRARLKQDINLVKLHKNTKRGDFAVCEVKPLFSNKVRKITRGQLIDEYTKLNGKKIRLVNLRGGSIYRVLGNGKRVFSIMPLPKCLLELPAPLTTKGSHQGENKVEVLTTGSKYLVQSPEDDVVILSRKRFNSLFEILDTPQEAINKLSKSTERYIPKPIRQVEEYHYVAVGRFVEHGRLQGFRLLNKANGKKADFTLEGVKKLVADGYVDNLVFSTGSKRSAYFRGNGMTLSEIPKIPIQ